jgi:predicted dehydrogenase
LKVIVVGYGSAGKRHVENLAKIPNVKIMILTKNKIEEKSSKIKIFNSINECIKEKPDAVIISNETSNHISYAIKFANAGINLFVEKPLSNSLKNIKKIQEIIKKKHLITQIGCQLRFHKCLKEIKSLLLKKRIGKVISAKVECGSFLPDWHQNENYKKGYSAREDLGGGVLLTCIHEIDYLYWFFGNVENVISITGQYGNLKISADDLSVGVLKFKNNIIAEFHLDYFQKPEFRSCKIIGTKGTIYWDSNSNIVKIYENEKNKWTEVLKWSKYERNLMFKQELMHFLGCIKKQKHTINPIEKDGVITLKIVLGIKKSARLGKMIKI